LADIARKEKVGTSYVSKVFNLKIHFTKNYQENINWHSAKDFKISGYYF